MIAGIPTGCPDSNLRRIRMTHDGSRSGTVVAASWFQNALLTSIIEQLKGSSAVTVKVIILRCKILLS